MHTGPVEIVAEMDARCEPAELFAWVDDLSLYPQWLEIVTRAEPAEDANGPGAPSAPSGPVGNGGHGGSATAWAVDLRGRIGPLARSKRLRMIRTRHDSPRSARFERAELDGRSHSPWTLEVEVAGKGDRSRLTMTLRYGGGLFGPVLERVLRDEIARSRERLVALVESGSSRS